MYKTIVNGIVMGQSRTQRMAMKTFKTCRMLYPWATITIETNNGFIITYQGGSND